MSRLTDLIAQVKAKDLSLGQELEREYKVLASRRSFGLNFERHVPESVELPGRAIRKGDKVRILTSRGKKAKLDKRLWKVKKLTKSGKEREAEIESVNSDEPKRKSILTEDLVVVAEFQDYIYPGLVSTGKVERGEDMPYHTVINGENYHALKALTFTHRGKIDAIYIDPPYNTGAKDWKYNNDYVESDDLYRHSKWLAMMERRLKLTKELLNPENSVLIVTIDEKEYLRLGLLLEQTFPEAIVESVTSIVNPRGRHRPNRFARSDEYIFVTMIGNSTVGKEIDPDFKGGSKVPWRTLRRSDATSARGTKKGGPEQFYPIYINGDGQIEEIGTALTQHVLREKAPARPGCVAVFPIRDSGLEMNWGLTAPALRDIHSKGFVRVGKKTPEKHQKWEISYLTSGKIDDIISGRAIVVGHSDDGSVIAEYVEDKLKTPTSCWDRPSHNAEIGGTRTLASILPGRRFPFPKSLYAVEDCLRFFVSDKSDATILDFFSGSGTTAHAVMRLNKQDGGRRQCISITNNEVGADEQKRLRKEGLRPGDADWEKWGICDYITKPRIEAAITGKTPEGEEIKGDYKFTDEFPMKEGLEENAEFFTLTYESPVSIGHNRAFSRIAPLLWIRAGSEGGRIDKVSQEGFEVSDTYGILFDLDRATPFCKEVKEGKRIRMAYIVTDDDRRFQSVARRIPDQVEPIRLYESYLNNFRFLMGN